LRKGLAHHPSPTDTDADREDHKLGAVRGAESCAELIGINISVIYEIVYCKKLIKVHRMSKIISLYSGGVAWGILAYG